MLPASALSGPVAAWAPRSVAASIASMRVADGFAIECVASEPLVQAPVAMCFDEWGRMLVLEMRSYMPDMQGTGEKLPSNRLVRLEDRDADGAFETSVVIADDLVLPRGVAASHGGILLIEPPWLLFLRDADGDGVPETRERLAGGFAGIENPEHAGNGLIRGIDNWWHLSQHHEEFHFDGTTLRARPTPVHGQWGLSMDDAGRLFYTPNSTPLLFDAFPKHLATPEPGAGIAENIARDAAATFPAHATPGVNRGYLDGVLRDDGTLASLTAACSPAVYRASLLGEDVRGDVFICEPAGQLVKRIRMTPASAARPLPSGRNAYERSEFLASDDERFRPVNAVVGPDGALYVCDMYRGVIQHKTYLTDYLRDQIRSRGLETPLNMGRIHRVAPAGFRPGPLPRLGDLSNEQLVERLGHPDGWHRDVAQRLLVERRAPVEAPLRSLLTSPEWTTRLHAFGTLRGLGRVEASDIAMAAGDAHPAVVAAALEAWADVPAALEIARALEIAGATHEAAARAVAASSAFAVAVRTMPATRTPAVASSIVAALSDAVSVDALVSSVAAHATAGRADAGAVIRHACAGEAWTDAKGVRRLVQRLAAWELKRSDASRLATVEASVDPSMAAAARAFLQDQVIRTVNPTSEQPRVLTLAAEPRGWMSLAAGPGERASALSRASVYFDWPGRPPVSRPRVLPDLTEGERALYRKGELLYAACAGCHQGQGQGSPGQAATLAGSAILNGPAEQAIKVVLHGLEGTYTVADRPFKGLMPPTVLASDEEYAAVLTYVRRSFGNRGSAVSEAEVGAVRAATRDRTRPFTREELQGR